MHRRAITASTLLLLAGTALAQSVNIDLERGSVNGVGAPATGYKGASGQGGVWNTLLVSSTAVTPIVDTAGAASGLTIQRTSSASGDSTSIPGATTDYSKTMADYAATYTPGSGSEYTISGLDEGFYRAYVYAYLPEDDGYFIDTFGAKTYYINALSAKLNGVTVGSTNTTGPAPANTFTKGVTHAVFSFKVGPGAPVLKIRSGAEFNQPNHERSAMNAIQLEKITATRLYVNHAANGAGTGFSWTDAFPSLADALELAKASQGQITEIWVAKGEYKPTATTSQTKAFELASGCNVYGGFAGNETLLSQRNPIANHTELSGGIGSTATGDNSHNIVRAVDLAVNPILDGFWIVGAYGGNSAPYDRGGGIYIKNASPIVRNCTIAGCDTDFGGAVYAEASGAMFENCTFYINYVSQDGGAIYHLGTEGGPLMVLVNCRFIDNFASDEGGGIYLAGNDMVLSNCLFNHNEADASGGAIVVKNPNLSTLWVMNSTFSKNRCFAATGGIFAGTGATVNVRNSILWDNSGNAGLGVQAGQFLTSGGTLNATYSCIQTSAAGPVAGTGNVKSDPLFVDPNGADNIPDNLDDDFRLMPQSPLIDAASNNNLTWDYTDLDRDGVSLEAVPLDMDMNPRRSDTPTPDTGAGGSPMVDMGAYERLIAPCSPDCENDGDLDVFDFLCFQGKFAAKDPYADFEKDGDWDIFDFLAFQNAFASGCP